MSASAGGRAPRRSAGSGGTRTGRHDVGINRQRWSRLEGPGGSGLFCLLILDNRKYFVESSLKVCSHAHRAASQPVRVLASLPDQRALRDGLITALAKVPTGGDASLMLKDMATLEHES